MLTFLLDEDGENASFFFLSCRFWRQVGGHLRIVECNSVGIVWGIGYDHTAWIYTGGYGGGFFQGLASSTDNIYTQTDVKSVYIYENQRWNPVTGYTNRYCTQSAYFQTSLTPAVHFSFSSGRLSQARPDVVIT